MEGAPGTFKYRPVSPINRDAMAAFLYRLAGAPAFTPTTQSFVDVPPGTQFYAEIEWLATTGISTGWGVGDQREYRPLQPINRDAMAAFLYRFVNGGTAPLTEQCGAPYPEPEPQPGPDVEAANQLANGFAVPGAAQSRNALAGLSVQAPGTMVGYDRALFPHWRDADSWGWPSEPVATCDIRQAALWREGRNVAYTSACDILSGTWLDAYTVVTLYDKSDVDVDHIVPLAEAWRAGAASWTTTQRTAFANDQLEVIAVDDGANQSKGDKGPDLWKPPNQAAHCLYAKRWIAIKTKYALTVSAPEKSALDSMLNTCAA
ncbi:HNH endonuclease [Propioniciclava sp. MC1683]|uniref:GmrSD restriction endonuclease domain-containing protein n=1 Tax=Propioniciclava sp. MC1683 TaxID=2760309 RepID=UPI001602257E|nr:DUF1524 domain-containing protein [Propioniciclava sp. MC1683]MBB1503112.1 HNH endonuclease [Propioniciclava sp. MC1683]